jgi:hypothetical protein
MLGIEQEIAKFKDINGDSLYLGAEIYIGGYDRKVDRGVYIVGFKDNHVYISYSKLQFKYAGSFRLDFTPLLVNPNPKK